MSSTKDGPSTNLFSPVPFKGNVPLSRLATTGISDQMSVSVEEAPSGACVGWGIPFEIGDVVVLKDRIIPVDLTPTMAQWLVFVHTSDHRNIGPTPDGFFSPMRGQGQLGEHAADYVILYQDGTEERVSIRRRHQISTFERRWGENCFEAVAHHKPHPVRGAHEQPRTGWGWSQTRVAAADSGPWVNWLWAWRNPHPDKAMVGIRFEPVSGTVVVMAISAGQASSLPLRWQARSKVVLTLPAGAAFDPKLDKQGLLSQVQLDMGQVISAAPRLLYANERWPETYDNQLPEQSKREVLIEYTAHPDAHFHLFDGSRVPIAQVEGFRSGSSLRMVQPARHRVTLRAVERDSGKCVPVKLHIHGEWGEYLAPLDRHRILNPAWFEDYSVDFVHGGAWEGSSFEPHCCTYISGETTIDLPLGKVYVEISKGFEIQPVRKVFEVTPETGEIVVELEKVLTWREQGWVTADTHVHFLSPMSALLEGSGEGVNIVNLLASQWGELMTNVGDFDGRTTWGSREAGGDGEYLVRVGTENRQHVLGHISLLGYGGRIIAPMTTGGPEESALGDPIEILLTEWARQCKKQGGVVVLPHFPQPRAEHAASIVSGDVDALEMTSWGNLYGGIDPYSLSDWYRYLNCGYPVAAVGGTDKMSANTAVGTVRTYARLAPGEMFTYEAWMDAVRRAETFVTYGPLLEFSVDGCPMGSRIEMSASGGTVDATWQVASATIPMSRVELIVNGEIRESVAVSSEQGKGHWSVKVDRSSWLALLVRGHYVDKPEMITAHSSSVMVWVEDSPMLAAADAVTILEQIEGALAYLDTVGTRAEDMAYKRMRLVLQSAHRSLHNRMHQLGTYHGHTLVTDHAEHQCG
ncbi:MAG TPA: CehA/McbA family metallohydrolase [Anaerolineae bacterium]|nr:CehA/McbA family metallohydrolase [Anaerolineae bacterium]